MTTTRRATYLTALCSYFQLGSVMAVGFMSIPLALHFLHIERVGLWTFTAQSLGYFLLIDFGVSNAIARMMADPIHRNDPTELSRWYSLVMVILTCQGLVVVTAGYLSVDWILAWFDLPAYLLPEARQLWLLMLTLNAAVFPLRLNNGILFAQNRAYWTTLSGAVALWVGLGAFWFFLREGAGSLAYGYSSVLTIGLSAVVPLTAVMRGPNRFRFSWRNIVWSDLRHLFGFSSYTFVIGIAVQIIVMSQEMILTKILGLAVVASYNISIKAGLMGMQIVWRTFDASIPRWQQMFVAGDMHHLRGSYRKYFSLALGMILAGVMVTFAANRLIVSTWARPDLHIGRWFDLALGIFMIQATFSHCLVPLLPMAKKLRIWALFAIIEAVLNICLGILFTRWLGPVGMLVASVTAGLVGASFMIWQVPGILGEKPWAFFRSLQRGVYIIAPISVLTGIGLAAFFPDISGVSVLAWEATVVVVAIGLLGFFFKAEIQNLLHPVLKRIGISPGALP